MKVNVQIVCLHIYVCANTRLEVQIETSYKPDRGMAEETTLNSSSYMRVLGSEIVPLSNCNDFFLGWAMTLIPVFL